MNASTRLMKLLLSRGAYLERLESAQLNRILPILSEAHEDVLGKIAATGGEWTREWLAQVATDIRQIYDAAKVKIDRELKPALQELAAEEAAYPTGAIDNLAIGISTTAPSPATLWATISALPATDGSTLASLMDALSVTASKSVIEAIQVGMVSGDNLDQMVRRLRGQVIRRASWRTGDDGQRRYIPGVYSGGAMEEGTTRSARLLARTAIMHVSNAAREFTYDANRDIIKGFQHVSTLDGDTCLVCGALDGKDYDIDEARPQLPIHPNCRCLYTPVLKSWRELGIDQDELPASTRASMDGQVPANQTYADRIASASTARRIELLGPARARLYAQGVPLSSMVADGQVVPLKELLSKAGGK